MDFVPARYICIYKNICIYHVGTCACSALVRFQHQHRLELEIAPPTSRNLRVGGLLDLLCCESGRHLILHILGIGRVAELLFDFLLLLLRFILPRRCHDGVGGPQERIQPLVPAIAIVAQIHGLLWRAALLLAFIWINLLLAVVAEDTSTLTQNAKTRLLSRILSPCTGVAKLETTISQQSMPTCTCAR